MAKAAEKQPQEATAPAEDIQVKVMNETGKLDDKGAASAALSSSFEQPSEQADDIISPAMAATVLKVPFAMAATAWGDYWLLSDNEAAMLSEPAAKVFSQFCGRFADRNPEVYMLGMAIILTVFPRALRTINEHRSKHIATTADKPQNAPNSAREQAAEDNLVPMPLPVPPPGHKGGAS